MIQSVERALQILELLDEAGAERLLGVLELSRLTGLKQPTVHNFLKTMTTLGYVAQDEATSKYYLADRTRFLGWHGGRKRCLAEVARPLARRLQERFNETVLFTVPERNLRITLFHINSSRPLRVHADASLDSKFYSSATGRCLLSGMTPEQLQGVLRVNGLPKGDEWEGVASRERLTAALEEIRRAGYALYCAEGVVAIGALIQLPERMVNAAVGLFLPQTRFGAEHSKQLITAVKETAAEIVRALRKVPEHGL